MDTNRTEKSAGKAQGGFTLIEVLIALSIFAIGILAAYTMQLRSSATAMMANSVSTSSNWAAYQIEELMAKSYDDFDDDEVFVQPDGLLSGTEPGSMYQVSWTVDEDTPIDGVKHVRMTVEKVAGLNAGQLYTHDYFKSNENL